MVDTPKNTSNSATPAMYASIIGALYLEITWPLKPLSDYLFNFRISLHKRFVCNHGQRYGNSVTTDFRRDHQARMQLLRLLLKLSMRYLKDLLGSHWQCINDDQD